MILLTVCDFDFDNFFSPRFDSERRLNCMNMMQIFSAEFSTFLTELFLKVILAEWVFAVQTRMQVREAINFR